MLRVVVQTTDIGAAANIGGPVEVSVRTFDIDAPDLEEHLREDLNNQWTHRQVLGVEVLPREG